MKRLLLVCLSLVACRGETPAPAVTDAAPAAKVVASTTASASAAVPAPAPVPEGTRVKGSINGGFAVDRMQFMAGAPIIVTLIATNTGPTPLQFDVGGDAGSVLMPLRYGVVVKDAQGAEVCNLQKAQPTGTGGVAASRTLEPKDRFREKLAINGACEGLLKPGPYTVTLVRRFSSQVGSDAGACNDLLPEETVPATASPACKAHLDAAPMIASDMKFEVVAYDGKALAKSLEPFVTEAKAATDLGQLPERLRYFEFLCRRVTCGCTMPKTGPELSPFMAAVVAKLPAAIPDKCP